MPEEPTQEPIEKTEPEAEGEALEGQEEPKEPEPKDKHGQPGINKERHEREVKALNEEIAGLKAKIEEMSKSEQGRKELQDKFDALEKKLEDERITHSLELAGCLDAKMAKAVLADYDNDVEKLKEAKGWLFGMKTGSTGGKPAGAPSDNIDELLDKAFHLE